MTILLIEDEPLIARQLLKIVRHLEPGATINGPLASVLSICDYFATRSPATQPDLVIADIQLADGVSFEAFQQVGLSSPVIFTTAYDAYAIRAFKLNSIDYLLKPIDPDELKAALAKFHQWSENRMPEFSGQFRQMMAQMASTVPQYKRRFSGQYLRQIVTIPQEEVACFLRNELIYLYTTEGKKLITEYNTLDELDDLVDPAQFFRINRQCLLNLDAVASYRTHEGQKLQVFLKSPNETLELMISKEKAGPFRYWLDG